MAATPLSAENQRELADLRARAYGPNAGNSLDPQEGQRLTELEDRARPEALSPAYTEPSNGASAPAAPMTPAPWWRAVPRSVILAATAVIGLGVGLAAPGLLSPSPHAVLSAAPSDRSGGGPTFGSHGVIVGAPTRHESFHDLDVWSAHLSNGAACVLVISGDATWRESGCSPRPLDPMAEVSTYAVIRAIEGLDLPNGSLVRFILSDGSVQVWIDENAAQSPERS